MEETATNNILWSSKIQGIMCLELSRDLRFRDDRKELILQLLGLRPGMTMVDVGCGPGTITRKLASWLGSSSQVIGVDRDTAFIEYARWKAEECGLKNVRFLEGDALTLPLESSSVDACTSHTVIEHVPNRAFLREQQRICRPGGRVSVMSVRPEAAVISVPDSAPQVSPREKELWEPLDRAFTEADQVNRVGAYWPSPARLPGLFQELGFVDVEVDAVALPVVPDDSRNSIEQKMAIIESQRNEAMERLEMGLRLLSHTLPEEHVVELRRLIDKRFAERLALANQGVALWDYHIAMVLIVSGVVGKQ